MKKSLAVLAVPALVLGVGVTAQAAPATRGGATLNVTVADGARINSSTTAAGSSLVFSGCGYAPGVGVVVGVLTPSGISSFGAPADANGCFSTASTQKFMAYEAGSYKASTWQSSTKRADATATFTVTN